MSQNQLDLLIKGNLVLPDEISYDSMVGVKNGKIVGIYDASVPPLAEKTIDASNCLVFPGIIDAHVHSYSMLNEGFEHATAAAAAGGVTTIIEMPYDQGAPVNSPKVFEDKIKLLKKLAKVDVALLATLPKSGKPSVIEPMAKLGACGFKLSVFETDPERFPRIEDDVLLEVMPLIKDQGLACGFHAENDVIIESLIAKFKEQGKTDPISHCRTRPPVSESLAVGKLLELAYWTKAKLHIYHCSHPRCMDMIDWYRAYGVDVTVETCPHYLLLNEEDMPNKAALAKINPPMRAPKDQEEMWEAVLRGEIDMLTSDHAPWTLENKQNPNIFKNGSGAPGLESLFQLMFSEAVMKRDLSPIALAKLLAENPAERFLLSPKKGRIALGADADFAILDPKQEWTFKASESVSSVKWSPFDGMKVKGKLLHTLVRGKQVFANGKVLAQSGDGEYVPAIHKK